MRQQHTVGCIGNELTDGQVKAEEELVNDPLLQYYLVEVGQEVLNIVKILESHLDTNRPGDIEHLGVEGVLAVEERTLITPVQVSQLVHCSFDVDGLLIAHEAGSEGTIEVSEPIIGVMLSPIMVVLVAIELTVVHLLTLIALHLALYHLTYLLLVVNDPLLNTLDNLLSL